MLSSRLELEITSFIVLSVLVMSTLTPAFAQGYIPGVVKGQYVKYGNFQGLGSGFESYVNNDWWKYEVTDVNDTVVTMLLTGQYKNGTAILGNGDYWVFNLEYVGVANNTGISYSPIIARNLVKNYPTTPYGTDAVNDTITSTYIGIGRTVNVLNYTKTTENSTDTLTYFYDRESGMLMEVYGKSVATQPSAVTKEFSFSVIDTNIFGLFAPILGIPALYFYIIVVALVIAVVAIAVFSRRRRSKNRRHRR